MTQVHPPDADTTKVSIAQRIEPAEVALDVLDSLLEGCQVVDFDYTYLFVNSTVARQGQRSREELLGRTMMECYPGIENTPMFAELRRCMTERTHHRMENEFIYPDGSKGWFELQFVPVPRGTCILSVDITERKRAQAALARSEEQLRQAQKMEAIGRLAGGVAHDFNNMLSVILSYAAFARQGLPRDTAAHADIVEIENAGKRASELTKQLLSFSRQRVVQPQIIDLNESVAGMDKMLQRLLGETVQLTTIASKAIGPVLADRSQVEQILLNLAVNARDAMPNGGKVTIETADVELEEEYTREHLGAKPGPHVMLAVSDSGVGMDRATQARIFEPFFSTKGGKGTGIGLATVYGIVQQSQGSIWVYSEPGKGTTFKVYFPRAQGAVPTPVIHHVSVPAPVGRETILVAEDDDQLRRLVVGILQRQGYEVLVAASPADAVAIAERHAQPIHLLLTDVVMPEMNGSELARRVRAFRHEMKVLYMSGYTGDVVVSHGVLEQDVAFVQKPVTPNALGRAVRAVLDGMDTPR